MSDTSPDFQQIPDSVSEADLRAALAKGIPQAANLPALRFGNADIGEGLHDLVIAHCLLIKQSEGNGPSLPQIISMTAYMADLLSSLMTSRYDAQAQSLERMAASDDPAERQAARVVKHISVSDVERGRLLLAQLTNAAHSIKADMMHALMAMEAIGALAKKPDRRPSERQRFISDALLDSAGVDRAEFDAYFDRKAAD